MSWTPLSMKRPALALTGQRSKQAAYSAHRLSSYRRARTRGLPVMALVRTSISKIKDVARHESSALSSSLPPSQLSLALPGTSQPAPLGESTEASCDRSAFSSLGVVSSGKDHRNDLSVISHAVSDETTGAPKRVAPHLSSVLDSDEAGNWLSQIKIEAADAAASAFSSVGSPSGAPELSTDLRYLDEALARWTQLSAPTHNVRQHDVQQQMLHQRQPGLNQHLRTHDSRVTRTRECHHDTSAVPSEGRCGPTTCEESATIFTCGRCAQTFATSRLLKAHLKTHGADSKPFACSQCRFRTSRKYTLVEHLRTHTKETPFKCPLCSYQASRRWQVTRHLRTHSHGRRRAPQPSQATAQSSGFASSEFARSA